MTTAPRDLIGGQYDTPHEHESLALDWYDGLNSALRNFGCGSPVSAKKLIREIAKVTADCNITRDIPKLKAFQDWTLREQTKVNTLNELQDAMAKALSNDLDHYDIQKALESAGWKP